MADLELEIVSTADSRGLTQAARDTDKLRGSTDKLGHEFHDTAMDSKELEQRVRGLRASVQSLGGEFARTGGLSVKRDLGAQRAMLREFERIAKENKGTPLGVTLGSALGTTAGRNAGRSFMSSFVEGIGQVPAKLRGSAIVLGVGIVAALAPAIGAGVAGLVTGAVGVGGIAGGIAASARDPQVKRAWRAFADTAKLEFFSVGSDFADETVKALGILQQAFRDLDLDESFERAAPHVGKLAKGIAALATNFMPGFNRALDRSGPALSVVERGLGDIGTALGDFVGDVAESEGALQGLAFAFNIVTGSITALNTVTTFLSDHYTDVISAGERWTEILQHAEPVLKVLFPLMEVFGSDLGRLNDEFERAAGLAQVSNDPVGRFKQQMGAAALGVIDLATGLAQKLPFSADRATEALDRQRMSAMELWQQYRLLSDAFGEFVGLQLSQDQATLRVQRSLFDFKETLKETGKDFRTTTEAGLRNRQLAIDLVAAWDSQREANINAGMDAGTATDQFLSQVDSLSKMAGKSKDAKKFLDELAGKYRVQVFFDVINEAVAMAASAAGAILKKVFKFQGGGTTPAFAPFQVHDGEMMFSDRQHYVASKSQMQRFGSMGGGGGTQTFQHTFHFSGDVDSAFSTAFQRLVQNGRIKILSSAVVNN